MVAYKSDRYLDFGWASAKLDDIVNYLPARITGLLLIISAFILNEHPIKAIQTWKKDSQKGPSPNGGIPIVTFAGAVDIQLGGDCQTKDGLIIKIPIVGGLRQKLETTDITKANIFIYASTIIIFISYFLLIKL